MNTKTTFLTLLFLALTLGVFAQAPAVPQTPAQPPKAYTITLPVEAWDFLLGALDSVSLPFRVYAPIRQAVFQQAADQNKPKPAQDSTAVKAQPVGKPKKE